jgi:uncharacterized protein RhaS with RHS repeats
LASETYPSGRVITTGYDGVNRSNLVSGLLNARATTYASNFTFAPHGEPTLYRYGSTVQNQDNLWRRISYNSRLQIGGYIDLVNNDTGSELLNVTLDWGTTNNNGNLQSAIQRNGGPGYPQFLTFNQNYGYDGVNRLNSVTDTGYTRSFGYDAWGNMWIAGHTVIDPVGSPPETSTGFNAKNQVTTGNASYDAAGNQTVVTGNTLTYDAENRLSSAYDGSNQNTENYLYDGLGQRVEKVKVDNQGTTLESRVYVYL